MGHDLKLTFVVIHVFPHMFVVGGDLSERKVFVATSMQDHQIWILSPLKSISTKVRTCPRIAGVSVYPVSPSMFEKA